jgi:long-chain acyl-CoA synthetase
MDGTSKIETIVDMVEQHARERPAHPALLMQGVRITYDELNEHAARVANGLMRCGLGVGARAAYLGKNHWSFFEVLLGAAKAGIVMVPINVRLALAEITWIANDAEAQVLFYGPEFEDRIEAIRRDCPGIRHFIPIADFSRWSMSQAAIPTGVAISGGQVCLQIYTSGTTGHPKGAQLTNTNLISCADSCIAAWGDWQARDVSLVVMPLFHIGATSIAVVALRAGATLSIMADANPSGILDTIEKDRVTKALLVPSVMLSLVSLPSRKTGLETLELICYGTAPMPLDVLRRSMDMFGCKFVQLYGLTETTAPITYLPPEDHERAGNKRMRSAGKAAPGVEFRIVDAEGKDLAPGEVGEVLCRTRQIMQGYWKRPEATADAIRDGWLHTGDAGYLDEDGYLYIHDRIKDLIVSGGENVYPAEVENAIFGHPAVADVAVVGVPDERWGEAVKACVVLKPGARATEEEIVAFARERIAAFKAPRSVDFLAQLPRNSTGKLLKRELRKPYWEGMERQVN